LQDNGGATLTHALLFGSPAIDAANPAAPGSGGNACDAVDQRGIARPADGDGNGSVLCDTGAYELGTSPFITYTYDKLYRLTNATYNAGQVFTYTYDTANRLATLKQGTVLTYTYSYNGLGDRVKQVVNGVPTTYTLDLNALA
jgi:YD repeat-containing protein